MFILYRILCVSWFGEVHIAIQCHLCHHGCNLTSSGCNQEPLHAVKLVSTAVQADLRCFICCILTGISFKRTKFVYPYSTWHRYCTEHLLTIIWETHTLNPASSLLKVTLILQWIQISVRKTFMIFSSANFIISAKFQSHTLLSRTWSLWVRLEFYWLATVSWKNFFEISKTSSGVPHSHSYTVGRFYQISFLFLQCFSFYW